MCVNVISRRLSFKCVFMWGCVCVCVCVLRARAQSAERRSLCDGFEAGRLWMLQREGRGEGPAQLHSGAGWVGEVR